MFKKIRNEKIINPLFETDPLAKAEEGKWTEEHKL